MLNYIAPLDHQLQLNMFVSSIKLETQVNQTAAVGCLLAKEMPFSMLAFNSGFSASNAFCSYSVKPAKSPLTTASSPFFPSFTRVAKNGSSVTWPAHPTQFRTALSTHIQPRGNDTSIMTWKTKYNSQVKPNPQAERIGYLRLHIGTLIHIRITIQGTHARLCKSCSSICLQWKQIQTRR